MATNFLTEVTESLTGDRGTLQVKVVVMKYNVVYIQ